MAQSYKYNRIDLATDAIRLVRILKGDEAQPIKCEIFETYLHQVEGVPYEALSYVWGIRRAADTIYLDECQFKVTENLYEALIHLRRPDKDRVLWIDAICIDQSHNAERGHQVGQMRLVYQNAQRVIVWLGASNCQIDRLFVRMKVLDQDVLAIPRPHTIRTWENQWLWIVWRLRCHDTLDEDTRAFKELLRREWFSRIWVLQEAALAKSATIVCGRNEVNSRAFVMIPSLLKINCGPGEQSRLDILPGLLRANSWWGESSSKSLISLIQKFGKSEASDPRDIIYALLGLSTDAHSSDFLLPNYQISLKEAIQRSVAYFMMQTYDLPTQTPILALPEWNLNEFLASVGNLAQNVFQWATDNGRGTLLYDLLISQRQKQDSRLIGRYMSCSGNYGPPITIAMKNEDLYLTTLLLEFPDLDVQMTDSDLNTPLSIATGQGNTFLANLILARREGDADWRATNEGMSWLLPLFHRVRLDTPLVIAVKEGDLAAVKSILERHEESTYVVDSWGDGLLNIAAQRGDEDIIDVLLKRANFEHHARFRGSDGLTPFESALVLGSPGSIDRFLGYHNDAVQKFITANQFEFLRKVLDVQPHLVEGWWKDSHLRPEDVHWCGLDTPLAAAVRAGHTRIVSLLLEKGADINLRASDGQTPTALWIAAARGNLHTVRLLVGRGADIELVADEFPSKPGRLETSVHEVGDVHCRTHTKAIWIAASLGYADIVGFLIQHGADIEARDSYYGVTPFWRAAQQNQPAVMRVLIEGGANIRANRLVGWGRWRMDHSRHHAVMSLKKRKLIAVN